MFGRLTVRDAVYQLRTADVIGFSAYVWNIQLSLAIAKALKELSADVVTIFGGPHVPKRVGRFLREHPYVDVVCHGEGEGVFLQLLEHLDGCRWNAVPSISYVCNGRIVHNGISPRRQELSSLPSPYISGTFDQLLQEHPEVEWQVLWETNRGCPFSCTFCDWGSAVASKIHRFGMDRLRLESEWFAEHRLKHIYICDANFGILPRDEEIASVLAGSYRKHGLLLGLTIQSTKNAPERAYAIHRQLHASGAVTVGATLSLQTVNKNTLKTIKRNNISKEAFRFLQQRYQQDGVEPYTDLLIGLPGDSYESFVRGVSEVMTDAPQNRLVFYNCAVLPNAEMADPDYVRQHGIEYVPVRLVYGFDPLDGMVEGDVPEYIDTVISTKTMPRHEWVRSRVLAWLAELLCCDRLMHLPLVLCAEVYGVSYQEMLEAIFVADEHYYPTCARIRGIFEGRAKAVQRGEPEHIPSQEWLSIWWRPDHFALVSLVLSDTLGTWFCEARSILSELLEARGIHPDHQVIADACALNQALVRVPFQNTNLQFHTSYNLLEWYSGVITGHRVPLELTKHTYNIDRTSWCWPDAESWCHDLVLTVFRRSLFLYRVEGFRQSQ